MATLIKTNGEEVEVTPKNKKHFSLEELQSFVGGYIELTETTDGRRMVVNEEGKLSGLPFNAKATQLFVGRNYDSIVGDALVCANKEIR